MVLLLPPPPARLDLYIGTYTDEGGGPGPVSRGIYRSRLNPETGALAAPVLAVAAPSPSYLALAPDGRTLYAVHESEATVGAYAVAPDGGLRLLNVEPSRGAAPCHLSLDPAGRAVYVANYGGSLAAFPVLRGGMLGPAATVFENAGAGLDPDRQRGPHLHAVAPDPSGRFVHACDLGTDEVLTFRVGAASGELALVSRAKTPAGAGPRHFVLGRGGRFLYANDELRPGVAAFARDPATGALTLRATVSVPVSTSGRAEPASGASTAEIALHPNGRWLYVSVRGADTIALLKIGRDGLPAFVESVPSGVREPRGFALDPSGKWLVAAGQRSGTVVAHRVDPKTGRLALAPGSVSKGSISVGKPVCVVFRGPTK